jgi:hypothetical protein
LIVGKSQGFANQAPKRGGEATFSWFCSQHHTKQAQGHQIIDHLVINWEFHNVKQEWTTKWRTLAHYQNDF